MREGTFFDTAKASAGMRRGSSKARSGSTIFVMVVEMTAALMTIARTPLFILHFFSDVNFLFIKYRPSARRNAIATAHAQRHLGSSNHPGHAWRYKSGPVVAAESIQVQGLAKWQYAPRINSCLTITKGFARTLVVQRRQFEFVRRDSNIDTW